MISDRSQGFDHLRQDAPRLYDDVDIDDGLGRQTRDGRAADVLDGQGKVADGNTEDLFDVCEVMRPLRVVRHDDYSAAGFG